MHAGTSHYRGVSALFGAALLYSSMGVLIRAMSPMYGDYAQVAARFVLSFLIFAGIVLYARSKIVLTRNEIATSLLLGIVFVLMVVFFTVSIMQTKIANSVFLIYIGSIVTSFVVGTFVLKERMHLSKWIALGCAIAALFMYSQSLAVLSVGVITGIIAGVFDGLANVIRKSLAHADRTSVVLFQLLGNALFATGVVFVFPQEPIIKQVSTLPILVTVVFALIQIGIGNLLQYGFRHADVNVAPAILIAEIPLAAIFGLLFLHETLQTHELVGGACIFAGLLVYTLRKA